MDTYALETNMVSMAKGRTKLGNSWFSKEGKRWPGAAWGHLLKCRKNVDTDVFNGIVRFAAEEGEIDKAERWMGKLDSRMGLETEVSTFNMMLQAQLTQKGIEEGEDWFARTTQRAIHPELAGLELNNKSYDIMILKAVQDADLPRLEKFLQESRDRGLHPSRRSFYGAVKTFLDAAQPKRAHHWLEVMVKEGCSKTKGYPPEEVRRVKKMAGTYRPFDHTEFLEVVLSVARGLAGARNTETANQWLEYVTRCGERPEGHAECWEYVRAQTPPVIVPARLTAESGPPAFCPEPTLLVPATLSGEAPRKPPEPGLPFCETLRSPGAGFISARTLRPTPVPEPTPSQESRSGASSSLSARAPEGSQRGPGQATPDSARGVRQPRRCMTPQQQQLRLRSQAATPLKGPLDDPPGDSGVRQPRGGQPARPAASPSWTGDAGRPATPMSPGLRRLVQLQRRSPTPVLGGAARSGQAGDA